MFVFLTVITVSFSYPPNDHSDCYLSSMQPSASTYVPLIIPMLLCDAPNCDPVTFFHLTCNSEHFVAALVNPIPVHVWD